MHFPFLVKIHGGAMEHPVIFMRKHPIILLGQLAIYVALALLPAVAYLVLPDVVDSWLAEQTSGTVTVLLLTLFGLSIALFAYNAFMDWYLDIWVVTDERIVDVNQSGVFGRAIAELQLAKVQDVAIEQKGLFATLFDYGRIRVQSAGEKVEFEFQGIARPNAIQKHIIELVQNDQQWHREALADQITGVN